MVNRPQREDSVPWYRQFWPWFLIAIPSMSVVAGVTTAVLALKEPQAMVVDDYAKIGLATHRNQARDERARALGLSGRLSLIGEPPRIELILDADEELDATETLFLTLAHPTLAQQDIRLELANVGNGWRGHLQRQPGSRRYVQIEPVSGEWRLIGELPEGGRSLDLLASVEAAD